MDEEPGRLQSMGSLRVGLDWATSLSRIEEGNGNPLQYSCLENPRERGAWWAAVYGVPQSRTLLKLLSSSSSSSLSLTCSSFSPAFRMMYSAYKLNKQGGQYTALTYSFPNLEPCLVLTVASWSAYRFLRRQVRWSGIPISWRIFQFVLIHTVKGFCIVNEREVDVFLEFSHFSYGPMDVGNLISGSFAFSKSSLNV